MNNTVVVGLGSICENHILPILEFSNLYGVCDIIKEKADSYAKKYNCKAFYNYNDVMKDDNVQCVHILTPHCLHFPMAKIASEAKKEIVLEKPAVLNMKEFDELKKVFAKNGTKCMVVLQNRYNPCIRYIKDKWDNLNLGTYLGSKGILTWYRTKEYYESSEWRSKYETSGGGLLTNQAPHIIDLITYFGGDIDMIEGQAELYFLKDLIEVEDTAMANIYFKNNTRSLIYATNDYVTNSPYDMEFVFENGVLRYMYEKLFLIDKDNKMTLLCEDNHNDGAKSYWGRSHSKIIKEFYKNGDYPTIEDYEKTAKVIEFLVSTKKKG